MPEPIMPSLDIATMVMMNWPLAGVVIGMVFAYVMLVQPVLRLMRYLLRSAETESVRWRARAVAYATVVAIPMLLGFVPTSLSVVVPGVLEPQDHLVLRAPSDGFVRSVSVVEGDRVIVGQPLVEISNPSLALYVVLAREELAAERARLETVELTEPTQVRFQKVQVEVLAAKLRRMQDRLAAMAVEAPQVGQVAVCSAPLGSFVHHGDELAQIHAGRPLLRLVLSDAEVSRTGLAVGDMVQLRWSVEPGRTVAARVRRILPSASRDQVPEALTVLGGGEIYGTARGGAELLADQSYLHVVVEPSYIPKSHSAGLTAKVRVSARTQTVGSWIYRQMTLFYNAWRMG